MAERPKGRLIAYRADRLGARLVSLMNAMRIAAEIGADRLFFQDLPDLIDAVQQGNSELGQFDTSCFTGEYITGGVTHDFLARQERLRNDDAKSARDLEESEVLDIRNAR